MRCLFLLILIILSSCEERSSRKAILVSQPDTSTYSLFSLQSLIFGPTCASAGCHDGHFEPDFRTLQSTFCTTVFHPIIKNNSAKEFEFRVFPYSRKQSVLFERITNCCFVNVDDRMPQDNIGVPLPDDQIEKIGEWIDAGARNIDGSVMSNPFEQGALMK